MKKCGIIIPVFNEEKSIIEITERINKLFNLQLANYSCEIIFINDGSTDNTKKEIKSAQEIFKNIQLINFRANLGKSLSLMAGFKKTTADIVITMDGDLQDNPEDIPEFIRLIESGYDMVNGCRASRKDGFVRKVGSRIYNKTVRNITGCQLHDFNCGFKAYKGQLSRMLTIYGDYHRYIPLIAYYMGFKVTEVQIANSKRRFGKSKYKAFRYQGLYDLLSIIFLYRYRFKPMHFFATLGSILLIPSSVVLIWFGISELFFLLGYGGIYMVVTRPIIIYSVGLMLAGLIIIMVGIICDFILHHESVVKVGNIIREYECD